MRAQSARGGSPLRFYSHEAPFITEGTRYDEGPARCAPTEVDKARGGSRIAPTRDLGGIFAGTA